MGRPDRAIGLTLLGAAALAACSQEDAPAPRAKSGAASAPAQAEAMSRSTAAPAQAMQSHYTALDRCREVESQAEGSFARSKCEAPGGLTFEFVTFDGRDDLRLGTSEKGAINLEMPSLGKGAFNALGPAVEWRGVDGPGGFVPEALIVRNRIFDKPERPDAARSVLAVIDIGKKCVVAEVAPGPGQNEAAREAASARGKCLTLK